MAKQIGILSLVGTIDGINFYLRNGKIVARKVGGGFYALKGGSAFGLEVVGVGWVEDCILYTVDCILYIVYYILYAVGCGWWL